MSIWEIFLGNLLRNSFEMMFINIHSSSSLSFGAKQIEISIRRVHYLQKRKLKFIIFAAKFCLPSWKLQGSSERSGQPLSGTISELASSISVRTENACRCSHTNSCYKFYKRFLRSHLSTVGPCDKTGTAETLKLGAVPHAWECLSNYALRLPRIHKRKLTNMQRCSTRTFRWIVWSWRFFPCVAWLVGKILLIPCACWCSSANLTSKFWIIIAIRAKVIMSPKK